MRTRLTLLIGGPRGGEVLSLDECQQQYDVSTHKPVPATWNPDRLSIESSPTVEIYAYDLFQFCIPVRMGIKNHNPVTDSHVVLSSLLKLDDRELAALVRSELRRDSAKWREAKYASS